MTKRTLSVYLVFLSGILLLATACGEKNKAAAKPVPGPVEVDIVIVKPESFSTEATGTVIASEFVELKPEVSGRIVQLNINEGTHISEGTLLAKLNDEDLQAQLRKYQSQLDIANKTQERLKKLLDVNGLNQQEYDVALNQVSGLQADIDYTKAQIRKTEVRAPFSGVIGLRNVSNGAFVTSQEILATLQQVDNLKVDFVLPEAEAESIKNGSMVKLHAGDADYTAQVMAIEPQVNAGTRNIKVRAILIDKTTLSPGSFVTIFIEMKKMILRSSFQPTQSFLSLGVKKSLSLRMAK